MNNNQINQALNGLQHGIVFSTPDNARSVPYTIARVTPNEIFITLDSGNEMSISRQAFFVANDFLQNNGHDINNPVRIGSSNEEDDSGQLCMVTRAQNNNVRCINYIVPILSHFGGVGFSGNRPNTCWYI